MIFVAVSLSCSINRQRETEIHLDSHVRNEFEWKYTEECKGNVVTFFEVLFSETIFHLSTPVENTVQQRR